MTKRVITGVVYALIVLAGIYYDGWVMTALLSISMFVATFEMIRALKRRDMKPIAPIGYLFCVLTTLTQVLQTKGANGFQLSILSLVICTMIACAQLVLRGKIATDELMATLFPMVYPGMFFVLLMGCVRLGSRPESMLALGAAFFSSSINDMMALFTGMAFGKHKLSPQISPKKTIEGSIGGLLFCVLFTLFLPEINGFVLGLFNAELAASMYNLYPRWFYALLGLMVGIASQIGDLTASMVKRHCGLKDYGKILPGHGGIMDRMDGVLFSGAVCYIFFRMAGLG